MISLEQKISARLRKASTARSATLRYRTGPSGNQNALSTGQCTLVELHGLNTGYAFTSQLYWRLGRKFSSNANRRSAHYGCGLDPEGRAGLRVGERVT